MFEVLTAVSINLAAFCVVLGLIWYLSTNYRQLMPKYRDLYRNVHSVELMGKELCNLCCANVVEYFQKRSEQLGNRDSIPARDKIFSSTQIRSDRFGAPSVSSLIYPADCFSGVERLGPKADYWPLSSAQFKNEWNCSYTWPYSFVTFTGTTLHLYIFEH